MINKKNDEIHDLLKQDFRKKIILIEMKIHQARQIRMENKVQRYFNSTPIRNAFARWMAYAFYEKEYYSITYLVKEMSTNRQTISNMISDCEAEGFIKVIRSGTTVTCQASDLLMDKVEDYCNFRKELTKYTIGNSYKALIEFEKKNFFK